MQSESIRTGPAWSRPEFLFTATAVMLLTGVLIPWPDQVMDVLWICQLSLTAAVLVICASARSSSQLDGFPPLLAVTSFLSFLATSGCIRAIVLRQDTCGRIVRALGDALTAMEPLLTLLLILVAGFFILYLVLQSSRRIRRRIEHYLFEILPFKQIGLETDRNLHILTEKQSGILQDKIRKEVRFYASMNGLRKLLTAQISVNLFLLLTAWGLAWTGEMLQATLAQSPSPLDVLAPILVGTALLSWLPVGATAAACGALLHKESLALTRSDPADEKNKSRTIKIISSVSGRPEEVELINPDFVSGPQNTGKPAERIAQFEPESPAGEPEKTGPEIRKIKLRCSSSEQYYQCLEKLFTHKSFQSCTLVLTAESVEDLPVTAAVHPAVQLARKKQEVLLIDADRQRHAVARVFSREPQSLQTPSPVPRIDSLWLQTLLKEETALQEIQDPKPEYIYRIVYAPQGGWIWDHKTDGIKENTRILFFSIKTPEEARPFCSGIPAAASVFLLPPLSAAITRQAYSGPPSATE